MAGSFDLVIKGGRVLDGTGNPWLKKDVGISEGKIKRVGYVERSDGETIDAEGMIVSPGIVDLHNHSDMGILAYPGGESYVMQGVTTVVVGNCGLALAPVNPDNLALLQRYLSPFGAGRGEQRWEWRTQAEFYGVVEKQGIAPNLAPFVGQGTVRIAVKGFDDSEASKEEMNEMKKLVVQGLEDGAFGLSTGLIYPPGSYSSTEELIELASVVKEYGGMYASHIRNEGHSLIEAVEEAIRIGEANDIPVEIVHHKASGRANWGKVNATLRLMEQARQRGVEVNCDVYPYTAGSTTITAVLPTWAMAGGVEKMLERLKDEKTRDSIAKEMSSGPMGGLEGIRNAGWDAIFIAACRKKEYEGKHLEEILKETNRSDDPYQGLLGLFLEIEGNASVVMFGMDEADVRTVMASPLSSIISDSWVTAPRAGGKPHPRTYGTFPRVLGKYVREEKLLTLEEAVRKMTSLPAAKVGLNDRGIIKEGFWADIVVFDADTIEDKATYTDPHQYPEGIKCVLVNGQAVVDQGKLTEAKPGRALKK